MKIELIPGVQGCVYKLWYADRYIVVKGKTLFRSVQSIETDLDYFFKGRNRDKNLYHNFYIHVQENPFKPFKIELVLSSNNPFELLKAEYLSLEKGRNDPQCLNKVFEVYVPDGTQVNGKKSWINRGYYLNFMNWKKQHCKTM